MNGLSLSPLPIHPLLEVDDIRGELDESLRMSINGPPSMTRSFSTSSSLCESFSSPSGRSTPHKSVEISTPYGHTMAFEFTPPPVYENSYMDPELKPQMARATYLEACLPEGYPTMPSRRYSEEIDAYGFDYPHLLDPSSVPQPFQSHGGSFSSSYTGPLVDAELRPTVFDTPPQMNPTVCVPGMCVLPPYPTDSAIPRGESHTSLPPRGSFGSSDSDSASSSTFGFAINDLPAPEERNRKSAREKRKKDSFQKRADQLARKANKSAPVMDSDSQGEDSTPVGLLEIKRISPGGFTCAVGGCGKSFNRKEHLKRHFNTTHEENPIKCPFCKEKNEKPFNRHDNFKHHIKIHSQPRSHGRVEYVPEAAAYYRKLVAETKPRKLSKKSSRL